MQATWEQLGLPASATMAVRDVWGQRNYTASGGRVDDPAVPGHGITLLVLTPM